VVWSPDGKHIVFSADDDNGSSIFIINADGTGLVRLSSSPSLQRTQR